MRRRRAILFDDDPAVLGVVALFFEEQGYDVIACTEPMSCAVYESGSPCDRERPCADVVVTDFEMPGMNGVELLEAQVRRGCPLTPMNKAVLSGALDAAAVEDVRRLGCAYFRKPFRLSEFAAWVQECESRMDLTRPLGALRKEPRVTCGPDRLVTVGLEGDECVAQVVNRSGSGMCLRIDRRPAVAQVLDVLSRPAGTPERLVVRWTKDDRAGGFLAGASCA